MAGGDDTGLGAKRFAPVAAALEPGVPLDWTEAAAGAAGAKL